MKSLYCEECGEYLMAGSGLVDCHCGWKQPTDEGIDAAEYESLQAECEKLRKDAARYQWLKHLAIKGSYDRDWEFPLVDAWEYRPGSEANIEHETLDAAIDAAMQVDNP